MAVTKQKGTTASGVAKAAKTSPTAKGVKASTAAKGVKSAKGVKASTAAKAAKSSPSAKAAKSSPSAKAAKSAPSAKPAKSSPTRKSSPTAKSTKSNPTAKSTKPTQPKLLSGGNPQIPKGDGDGPVKAYIAALPGWKSGLALRLDALIERAVPGVRKAVKWNSPFYGVEGQGYFMGVHAFDKYLKLAFFRGTELDPLPPGPSKSPEVRYLDIREDDALDERQLTRWLKQAAALPGWTP